MKKITEFNGIFFKENIVMYRNMGNNIKSAANYLIDIKDKDKDKNKGYEELTDEDSLENKEDIQRGIDLSTELGTKETEKEETEVNRKIAEAKKMVKLLSGDNKKYDEVIIGERQRWNKKATDTLNS